MRGRKNDLAAYPQPQTPLGAALIAAIAERGPITFRDFMAIALYHAEGGYYTSDTRQRQGWEGDYLTSVDLHPLFGAALGRQLAQIWELFDRPDPFVVLEDGAGRGLLARDIAVWAGDPDGDAPPGFAAALHYRQRDMTPTGRQEVPDGPAPAPHVILSNELIDAFPVHIIERTAADLAEIYVDVAGATYGSEVAGESPRLVERAGPLSTPELAAYLDRYAIDWRAMAPGWRAEINLDAERWMAETAQRLGSRGVVLTIDYGDTARQLYSPARRQGTLAAYRRHEVAEDPLALVGAQDLTAHVNFSALIAVGRSQGLRLAGLATQRDVLLALGIRADGDRLGSRLYPHATTARHTDAGQTDYLRLASLRHRIAALLDPAGMGGFRVLIQQRGLPGARTRLRGLQHPA